MCEASDLVNTIVSWMERGGRLGADDTNFLRRNMEKLDSMELISARDIRGLRDIAVLVKLWEGEGGVCHRCGNKRCGAIAL